MQFATTLGWTLIHFVWQGFAVLIAYLLVMPMLRQRRPETRYLFSVATLTVLTVLPITTFFYITQGAAADANAGLQTLANMAINATSGGPEFTLSSVLEPALPYAVLAWMAGVIVMMIRFSIGLTEVNRLRNTAQWNIPASWQASLDSLVERMDVSAEVGLAMSNLVQSPLVIGWLKPLILVPPSALTGLTAQQMEMILAHELEHIRRWDYLVNLWQVAVESFLFYHPAIRIVSRRIRIDRESCCDDAAVRLCGNPIGYARALAHLEGMRQGNMLAVNFHMGIADGRLLDRIQRLVGHSRHIQQGSLWFTGAFMIGILTMSVVATHLSFKTFESEELKPVLSTVSLSVSTPRLAVPASEAIVERAMNDPAELTSETEEVDSSSSIAVQDKRDSETVETRAPVAPVAKAPAVEVAVMTTPVRTSHNESTEFVATSLEDVNASTDLTPIELTTAETKQDEVPVHAPIESGGELLHAVNPEFPRQAKRQGISGHVKIAFTVGANGRVKNAEILEAEPKNYFEDAALDAIEQWRFEPFMTDGVPRDKRVKQQIDFNLDSYLASNSPRNCFRRTGSRICRSPTNAMQKDQRVAIIKLD